MLCKLCWTLFIHHHDYNLILMFTFIEVTEVLIALLPIPTYSKALCNLLEWQFLICWKPWVDLGYLRCSAVVFEFMFTLVTYLESLWAVTVYTLSLFVHLSCDMQLGSWFDLRSNIYTSPCASIGFSPLTWTPVSNKWLGIHCAWIPCCLYCICDPESW